MHEHGSKSIAIFWPNKCSKVLGFITHPLLSTITRLSKWWLRTMSTVSCYISLPFYMFPKPSIQLISPKYMLFVHPHFPTTPRPIQPFHGPYSQYLESSYIPLGVFTTLFIPVEPLNGWQMLQMCHNLFLSPMPTPFKTLVQNSSIELHHCWAQQSYAALHIKTHFNSSSVDFQLWSRGSVGIPVQDKGIMDYLNTSSASGLLIRLQ